MGWFKRTKPEVIEESKPKILLRSNILALMLGLEKNIRVEIDLPKTAIQTPKLDALEPMMVILGDEIRSLIVGYRSRNYEEIREQLHRCSLAYDMIVQYVVSLGYEFRTQEETEFEEAFK